MAELAEIAETDEMDGDGAIAIVGMAGRFPRARNLAAFWRNLCEGVEAVSFFTDEELSEAGVEPSSLADPAYVKARAMLEDFALFDAGFFGLSAREAEITAPQHRLFLECCWQALEEAGYDPAGFPGEIGVFASASSSPYLHTLYAHPEILRRLGAFRVHLANEKEFLPSWISYKLDLRGPSVNVQTACSSSLVAVHFACQSLLSGECDMALAGGVSVRNLVKAGYFYQEGGILSPDGHCRAFSAEAAGTLDGDGVGVVVLKRLEDALAGGDSIRAVVRGSAINNDGSAKVGYTAPGLAGQSRVIAEALSIAGVHPATVRYVEAHGTGTRLGDPIEIAALTEAFRARTAARGFCAVGSVKTNLGHLDAAAGVAGLIKAALALEHGLIPPSLHCVETHPEIDFESSPFRVNTALTEWRRGREPRRAGVSSFGIGGTNSHVILEEAPATCSGASRPWQLLVWSARSETAVTAATAELGRFLAAAEGVDLADAAFTLQSGRRGFVHRRAVACRERSEAAEILLGGDPRRLLRSEATATAGPRPVAFLFPGQGAQRAGATAEIYAEEAVFRAEVDRCARLLESQLDGDLREVLYPAVKDSGAAERRLAETAWTQPAMFVVGYALSRLWMSWGIRPAALLGHSVGEYVAACLAGVIELGDALALMAERGRLMQALPTGGMLALPLSEEEVASLLGEDLSLAAVNGPRRTVVAGPLAALDTLEHRLAERAVKGRRLATSHAFHSRMMEPAAARLAARAVPGRAPEIPYLSNLTGDWITPEDLADPAYWSRHMCGTVRFGAAAARLLAERDWALLEVGPGRTLASLLERHPARRPGHAIIPSLPSGPSAPVTEQSALLEALGRLWVAGVEVDWAGFSHGEHRRRVPLPTYPFERQRYLVERPQPAGPSSPSPPVTPAEEIRMPESPTDPRSASLKRTAILQVLKEVVYDLTGTEVERIDPSVSFLDAGVDSLLLIQAAQQIQDRFDVKISLVQLLEELPTLDDVASHLERELPAERLAALLPAAPPPSMPAAVAASVATAPAAMAAVEPRPPAPPAGEDAAAPTAVVERILAQQLELLAQQLQVLRGMQGQPSQPSQQVPPPTPALPPPAAAASVAPAPAFSRFGPYQPLEVGPQGGLTPGQKTYLADFVRRYTARTARSKQITREHRPALADGRASVGFRRLWKELVYPIHGGRSRGSRLWDVDGNEYVDVCMGFGLHFFGHSPDFVQAALRRQIEEGIEIGPQSPLAGRAAELLCELTGLDRVAFCNSGTEAIMGALRVARTATRRHKIALFAGSYHGWFDGAMVRSQLRRGERVTVPAAPGVSPQSLGDILVLDYDSDESLAILEKHGHELAAVLVEPVRSRSPEIQPRRFLHRLREITSRSGALLIFDEMVTGFRIHLGGAQAWFDVAADLVTYGKLVAGGLPIGVVAGRAAPMDVLDGGMWEFGDESYPRADKTMFAGSYFKHPLVLAAAVAVLERLRDEGPGLQAELNRRTARMVGELNTEIVASGVPLELVSFGSLFRFRFAPELQFADLFPYHLIERGVFYGLESGNCFLTPAHSDADIALIKEAVRRSLRELQRGGFLPPPPPLGPGDRAPIDAAAEAVEAAEAEPAAAWREVPATEFQHALWVVSQMEPDASRAYNEPIVFRLRGPFDLAAMTRSLEKVVDRHAALRASFDPEGTHWRIAPALEVGIAAADFTAGTGGEGEARIREWLARQAGEPFDLERGPLFRCGVARLGEEDHYLALTLHHMVIDGPASSVLVRELRDLYAAEVTGRPCLLPAPRAFDEPRPGKASSGEDLAAAEAYWTALFAPPVPFLELPADRPRQGLAQYAGSRRSLALDATLFAQIRALGAGGRATPFMTLLAACGALLHRFTGQTDLPLGVPLRDPLASGAKVGYFVNLMPLRLRRESLEGFRPYLGRVKRSLLEAEEHRAYPLARLAEKLQGGETPGRSLVAATFNLDRGGEAPSFPGLTAEVVRVHPGASKFDLAWNLTEERAALLVECDFRRDQFDGPTIDRLLGRFGVLLASILAAPDVPLADLPWLTPEERHQILEWNATAVRYPGEPLLHRQIEAQVARTPGATALVFANRPLTYAALNARANRLARHLRRVGVGPDVPVAVAIERSPEMMVALLGVLKAGGAYVPLDPSYPRERLAYMLGDALAGVKAPVLLTQEKLRGLWEDREAASPLPPGLAILPIEKVEEGLVGEPAGDLAADLPDAAAPDHLAYVIYTSGSTGRPKGAMNTHRAIVNRLLWMQETYGLTARDRVLQKTPLSFDVSVWELFWPLMTGATLVLALPEGHKDAGYLVELIAEQEITTAHFVPALLNAFLEEPDLDRCVTLRRVIASGEALTADLERRFFSRLPGALHNLYGPTEAAVDVTFHACSPSVRERAVPIGRPIANLAIHLLDAASQPVPEGMPGELAIGGVGLARGYLRRPELTAEKFVPHPGSERPGERLYRTGDLARFRPDGVLEYLGRLDHQVKIRGFRIELEEIASVLERHPAVREAVVLVREERSGDRRLVAYVAPRGAAVSSTDSTDQRGDLRAYLAERLPEHMVPLFFVLLPALPLLPNGKVDRRSLAGMAPAELVAGPSAAPAPIAPPRNAREELLASIWCAVLRRERIGVDENFFALGGDSILSIQIVSRARRAGLRLIPRQLFEHPTIAALAAAAMPMGPGRAPGFAEDSGPVTGAFPQTPIQRWFFAQELVHPERFNHALLLAVEETVGAARLAAAVELLQVHHDALRLRFTAPSEAVHAGPEAVSPLVQVDLAAIPEERRPAALEAAADALQGSLDLRAGPLCRWALFAAGPGSPSRLLALVHHLAVDGVSWRILLEDLETLCWQLGGGPVALPPRTTSLKRWAERLAAHARSAGVFAETGFWQGVLRRAPAPLPMPVPKDGVSRVAAARHLTAELDPAETRALLEEVPRAWRTQINEALLTALVEATAAWTGSRRLLLDLEGHGREEIGDDLDLSRTVGWFTALFPVLLDLDGVAEPGAALVAVQEQLRAIPGRGLGYGLLRYLAGPESAAALGDLPRAEILFNYLGQLDGAAAGDGLLRPVAGAVGEGRHGAQARSHLLEVNISVQDGRLRSLWTYGADHLDRATVERLAAGFLAALRGILAHCRSAAWAPSDFQLAALDRSTLDRLIAELGAIEDVYPASPVQEGMLFHTLAAPESGVYVEQVSLALGGEIAPAAFREAWRRLVARHAILRTVFFRPSPERLLQVVRVRAELAWEDLDWRGLTAAEQADRLRAHLEADRRRGFDPGTAPPLRFTLIHTGEAAFRFVWSFHHVLLDGWSLPILLRELAALHAAASRGEEASLPPVRPFRDYIAWLTEQDLSEAEAFWRRALGGLPAPEPLGIDRGSHAAAEARHGERRASLEPAATEALRGFARRHQLTLNTLVQGAWALLLQRYGGGEDLVFGAVTSGRSAPVSGIEEIVGLFINTLPARVRIRPRQAIVAWLAELQEAQAEVRQYEHCPLSRVQAWSGVRAGQPLFESLIAFENYPLDAAAGEQAGRGLGVTEAEFREQIQEPLGLVAMAQATLDLKLLHDPGRFAPVDAARLLPHLTSLLTGMAGVPTAAPGLPLADLPLLSAAERHQLLQEWSDTARPAAASPAPAAGVPGCLHQLFERQAERTPAAAALTFQGTALSYGELNARANRLAHALRRRGAGPETRIAVLFARTPEMVVALLAILKAGGAYVPLDPLYPRQRLAFMVEDSGVALVLATESTATALAGGAAPILLLDPETAAGEAIAGESNADPAPLAGPGNLAYVIYTSGSTGRPKGVAIEHGSAVELCRWSREVFPDADLEGVLAATSICFDLSVFELFVPLGRGGRVLLAENALELPSLADFAAVSLLNTVPSAIATLAAGELPPGLRTVNLAGEALPARTVERLYAHPQVGRVVNLYGPSEDTTYSTFAVMPREPGRVTIGRPVAGTQARVLDTELRPVPAGAAGDLYLAGAGLARGYLGRPELTADRFVPDPWSERPGGRLYRTGDLARFATDGQLEFLGRADHQVKIRGFRIELGEIESILAEHPAVREAVVVVAAAEEQRPGEARLLACVVPRDGRDGRDGEARREELWAALRRRVPEHMVPAVLLALPALPLLPNGKVDRTALSRLAAPSSPSLPEAASASFRSPIVELLAVLFAETLRLDHVGPEDGFFALGGHSLLAAQLAMRVEGALGVPLPLRAVFEAPTPAALAVVVLGKLRSGRVDGPPPISRIPRGDEPPLSFAQERLWFLDQMDPGGSAYNIPVAVRLDGELGVAALAAALAAVVERHEVLRSSFPTVLGRPVAEIAPPALPSLIALPVVDLAGLPDPETEARRLARREAGRPFDLARGPLVRSALLRLGPAAHVALLTFHHIVFDGGSAGVLVRELTALYPAAVARRPSPQPELPVQYGDYAAWQRSWLQGATLAEQLAYWRERLAGAPARLDLPTDRPRPPVQSFSGGRASFAVPAATAAGLRALARQEGVTLFMALLAAYGAQLARYTDRDDLLIGTPIANRTHREVEGLIGFFVNTLALRADLAGRPTAIELLARLREVAIQAYAHQDVPFERLVEELRPERNLSHAPLFQVMLVVEPAAEPASLPGLTLRLFGGEAGTAAKFDLTLMLAESGEGLAGTWGYSTDLFDAVTLARFSAHLLHLLAGIVDAPRRPLAELPLLTAFERQELLSEWSLASILPGAPEEPGCLHDLFAAQAARDPAAVALVLGPDRLTYGQLAERVRRLARRLRTLGVGPEVRVGLCLGRSFEMVLGLLAILEAGGAYVPVDPANPRDRLLFLLGDSRVPLLLTQTSLAGTLVEPLADTGTRVLCLDEEWPDVAEAVDGPRAAPGNLAYVIYTSGSTGAPNGVLVEHAGAVNLLRAAHRLYAVRPGSRVLQTASLGFDASVLEIFLALGSGATLCLVREEDRLTPAVLAELLVRQRVTTAVLTPAQLALLPERELPGLSAVSVGGEACPAELAAVWAGGRRLLNCYGPTEATIFATVARCDPRQAAAGVAPPLGRPVHGVETYVLDAHRQPVPAGVPGELAIGGVGLARGYLGRPEKTAERFVPHPFAARRGAPGARLYRTGDLARFRPDGSLEFLGRLDEQVKIRGFRVELGEIEAALAALPAVEAAVVTARGEGAAKRLVAYVVARAGEALSIPALRAALGERLPDYMLPGAWVFLPGLPLSPSGKVDRRALPEPEAERPSERPSAPPRTPLERFLVELWREVLRVETVGVHDDFFALGGHSIAGAVVVNRLQETLGEIVHVIVMFDTPTVAGLAAYLAEQYPDAVEGLWGRESLYGRSGASARRRERIGGAEIEELRRLIPPFPALPATSSATQNPRAIFVLSPPRSGSTLLRVMLGGHPRLFSPPELELLSFPTLTARAAAFAGRNRFWLEGVVRAVMELRGCTAEAAEALIAGLAEQGGTTREMYRRLQAWSGGRVLVDKTPSYALDPGVLARAEEVFAEPLYIHLVRHPLGMVHSFEEARLDQVFFRHPHPFGRRDLAELLWVLSQQNILRFLGRVPAERQYRLHFEDLVRDPAATLEELCGFLGLDFYPAMADPYREKKTRMTDGIHPWSRMLGDVKFHEHRGVDAGVSEKWRARHAESELGEVTRELAATLGYSLEPARRAFTAIQPAGEGPAPLSFSQQRLWFLDRLKPGSVAYNLPLAVRLEGPLDVAALASSLTEIARRHAVLRTTFAAAGGEPLAVAAPPGPVPLPIVDLRDLPAATRPAAAARLLADEARRPFDLALGPLLRATLVRLGDAEHALLLTLHHILGDGWSMGILVRELGALYEAFAGRLPSPLPDLGIQYADFARWQRSALAGQLAAEVVWWRQQLQGLPPALDLPLDRPRRAVSTRPGALRPLRLAAATGRAFHALSRRHGATLFMTLLAAFQALLARYAGEEDFAVGTPVAGRHHRQAEELIGFFVNTLILRTELPGGGGFDDLLARVRRSALAAYAHQDLPFEKLVEELRPPRDLGRTPFFQVMFSLENPPAAPLTVPGLTLSPFPLESGAAKFDLSLTLCEVGGRVAGSLVYAADLFDGATADRLLRHFATLLDHLLAAPERPLGEVPLLTAAEEHALCREWSDSATAGTPGRAVHERIAARAARTPGAVALVRAGEELTFEQLRARTVRLARRLRRLGVGLETPVGLLLDRSLHLPVAILAILEAGGAYVPLDPAHPRDRQELALADAGVSLLLTAGHCRETLPGGAFTVLDLDALDAADMEDTLDAAELAAESAAPVVPESLACVLFTSGSTGRPKGIMVPHGGLANYLGWCVEHYAVEAGHGAPVHSSVAFDLTITSLLSPLLAGRAVHLLPEEEGIEALGQALAARPGWSLVKITPAHLEVLGRTLAGAAADGVVGTVVLGGEALFRESLAAWRAAAPATRLINEYGPTETVVGCAIHEVAPGEPSTGAVPIGRPIANARLHVWDAGGHEVPLGVSGELYVGGSGVTRGYVSRPDLTAERFVPDPSSGVPGARLYRTGDRVRRLADGALEFLGRVDRQVKIRGFRIEPGEVESVLVGLPGVAEAAVEVWEPAPGDRRLVAYLVATGGEKLAASALAASLRDRLPEPMVPAAFVQLEALPLTANGKVDRRALPVPETSRPAGERGLVPPRTPLERVLVEMWEELLARRPIGIRDSFFELGGHSLLSVRLLAQVERRFGRSLPLATLFAEPTIEHLARCLEAAGVAPAWSPLVPIQTGGTRSPFFCVHPIGGAVQGYRHLARHLGTDQPFYGLQAPGLESMVGDTHTAIEEMATAYSRQIREVQPQGPYRLGGWSFGGVVAFEMARQLAATGEGIALLALFDTPVPAGTSVPLPELPMLLTGLARDQARELGREWVLPADLLRGLAQEDQMTRLLAEMRRLDIVGPEIDLAWLRRFLDRLLARMSALRAYTALPFPGRLDLFRASDIDPEHLAASSPERRRQLEDPTLGWGRLALAGVDVHPVPGHHANMTLEPHVRHLARALADRLAATEPVPARPAAAARLTGASATVTDFAGRT